MEIKCLRTFLAVVACGTYARAAEQLGYTQSTVTVHIKQLEQDLGIPLFERIGRRMVLTQKGTEALAQAADVVAAADRLEALASDQGELTGELHVDMAESLLCHAMNRVIAEFREQAPSVRLRLRDRSCAQISQSLQHGDCDLGVLYAVDWTLTDIAVETVATVGTVAVASPAVEPIDLVTPGGHIALPFITDEPEGVFRVGFERYLDERDIRLADTVELWTAQAIKKLVSLGMGFTVTPRFMMAEELDCGAFREIPCPYASETFPVMLAHRKTTWLTPAARLFMDLARQHLPTAVGSR
uniref:LysR family transcriptional regulator n=1 Tax=Muribaculaceae bacterium Z82 TaxID=2304548 RepID=A0A7C9N8Q5_9BACT